MPDRYATGMQVRREVLGDAHVDRAEAAKTDLDAPFQDLITQSAWGTVWASDAITRAGSRCVITNFASGYTASSASMPNMWAGVLSRHRFGGRRHCSSFSTRSW